MSQQFDNTNRFTLFKNDKEGNERRPDYTGKINVNGVDMKLSAWIKDGRSGKFMSGTVEPIQERQQQRQETKRDDPFDDGSEIPF